MTMHLWALNLFLINYGPSIGLEFIDNKKYSNKCNRDEVQTVMRCKIIGAKFSYENDLIRLLHVGQKLALKLPTG